MNCALLALSNEDLSGEVVDCAEKGTKELRLAVESSEMGTEGESLDCAATAAAADSLLARLAVAAATEAAIVLLTRELNEVELAAGG